MTNNYEPVFIRHAKRRGFIELPFRLYKGDSCWVPPLRSEMKAKLDPRKNPFFEYGDVRLVGVLDAGKKLVGRAAAILNPAHNRKFNDKTGFFGLFECEDDPRAASVLVESLKSVVKKWGCDRIAGPVNFTMNDESGFLIEGFGSKPVFMTNYCFPYYKRLMEENGFVKSEDLLSFAWRSDHAYPEGFERLAARAEKGAGIAIRSLDRRKLDEELLRIKGIYNRSFEKVPGFVPITAGEVDEMGKAFRLVADDDIILFAERCGRTVGFCLALPDVNEIFYALKGRLFPFGIFNLAFGIKRVKGVRLLVLCTDPEFRTMGIVALLIRRLHEIGSKKGYVNGELAVVLESNTQMMKILAYLGFDPVKRYRIYESGIDERSRAL